MIIKNGRSTVDKHYSYEVGVKIDMFGEVYPQTYECTTEFNPDHNKWYLTIDTGHFNIRLDITHIIEFVEREKNDQVRSKEK